MASNFNTYEQIVYDTAKGQGASDVFARIIISQLKHESADFKSNVFKQNNNPMGMKVPSIRKSPYIAGKGTQPPSNEGSTPYARYNSLQDAVKDLFHWLNYTKINWQNVTTIPQYSELLRQKSYMGNTQTAKNIYIAGLTKWFNKLAGFTPLPNVLPVLALISLVIIFLIIK